MNNKYTEFCEKFNGQEIRFCHRMIHVNESRRRWGAHDGRIKDQRNQPFAFDGILVNSDNIDYYIFINQIDLKWVKNNNEKMYNALIILVLGADH